MLKRLFRLLFPDSQKPSDTSDHSLTYGLELLFDSGDIWKDPSESEFTQALTYIEQAPRSWITISRGFADFITVINNDQDGFTVEYEAGGRDFHQRIDVPPLSAQQVLKILLLYGLGCEEFYDNWDWQKVPISEVDLRKAPRLVHGDLFNDPEQRS